MSLNEESPLPRISDTNIFKTITSNSFSVSANFSNGYFYSNCQESLSSLYYKDVTLTAIKTSKENTLTLLNKNNYSLYIKPQTIFTFRIPNTKQVISIGKKNIKLNLTAENPSFDTNFRATIGENPSYSMKITKLYPKTLSKYELSYYIEPNLHNLFALYENKWSG